MARRLWEVEVSRGHTVAPRNSREKGGHRLGFLDTDDVLRRKK